MQRRESRKDDWLGLHDRRTGGIPGLLPFALDMPVRFTDAIDKASREMGVFKHCRGILRGWQLPEEEAKRVEESQDAEVVLNSWPLYLFIEVPTATKSMLRVDGKPVYALNVQM